MSENRAFRQKTNQNEVTPAIGGGCGCGDGTRSRAALTDWKPFISLNESSAARLAKRAGSYLDLDVQF